MADADVPAGADGGFVEKRFSAPDGLTLSARIYGEGLKDALPVICLPGLTRNARDFHPLALHLSQKARIARTVFVFDYRGRGRSDHDPDWRNYTVAVETDDLLAGMTVLGIAEAAFVGTSRGGLIVQALSALRPAAIRAAVLNDVGPVLEGAGLAQIRAFLERAPKPATSEEAVRILKTTYGPAFTALQEDDWRRMAHAIYRDENGRPVADYDPRLLKSLKGIDFGKPLPVFWASFLGLRRVPMLAIRGENSNLLSQDTLDEMARRHETLQTIVVPGQGHAPLLETGELPRRIETFLDRI